MFKRFLSLEWKQFSRSSYFQKGIAIKILLILAALYFGGCFLVLGTSAFFILEDTFPKEDPVSIVNNYLIFWFLIDMVFRFFIQQLPVMNIKPYMIIPIKRKTVIHFLLGKTTVSFFNFLPLFFFLPFTIVLLVQGYNPLNAVAWFFSMLFFTLSINYLNFLLNKNDKIFYAILTILIAGLALEFYDIYPIAEKAGIFFNTIYEKPYAVLIPLLLMVLLYRRTYSFIRKGFYLDAEISKKTKTVKTSELNWLNRFGDMAIFLKNDIRMIMRNKRPKKVLFAAGLFLFYGVLILSLDMYKDSNFMLILASLMVSGGFLMTFGQLVPSWDSEYYKLLMSQNIPYRKYLESKWYLMVVATIISFVLATPYIYFGWKVYGIIVAGFFFNIGIVSFVTLYGGVYNKIPVELNVKAKAFSNTQGFNVTQLLIALPKLVLPFLLFYIPYLLVNFTAGVITLGLSGVIGILCKNFFFNYIEKVYQKEKYKTIAAFDEKA